MNYSFQEHVMYLLLLIFYCQTIAYGMEDRNQHPPKPFLCLFPNALTTDQRIPDLFFLSHSPCHQENERMKIDVQEDETEPDDYSFVNSYPHLSENSHGKRSESPFSTFQIPRLCQLTPTLQIQSTYVQALMRYTYRTNTIADAQAFYFFECVRRSPHSTHLAKMRAFYYQALMGFYYRTYKLEDTLIYSRFNFANCICDLTDDPLIPQPKLYKASMWIDKRTNALDNITAFNLLDEVCLDQRASNDDKIHAILYKAIMRFNNQTEAIDDKTAFQILTTISNDETVANTYKMPAMIYQALFRYHDRTEIIDDLWSMSLLMTLVSSPDESARKFKERAIKLHKQFMKKRGTSYPFSFIIDFV